jgi:pyridoxal phosphate enzyme (YggS family)
MSGADSIEICANMNNAGRHLDKMNNLVAQRVMEIRQQLPEAVRLIAVSKGVSSAAMRLAYAAGVRDFGESRVTEAIDKQQALSDLSDICWHMIGHLQTNKVRKAVQIFQWIHSVDSLRLLQQLERVAGELTCQPAICLQVKIVPDPHKYGWTIPELLADLAEIDRCQHLRVKGLMAIAPLGLDPQQSIDLFSALRQLREQIQAIPWQHIALSELSMGMSDDYQCAVASGATMVRLGSKIFRD